jgi:hypothetical protein
MDQQEARFRVAIETVLIGDFDGVLARLILGLFLGLGWLLDSRFVLVLLK